MTEKGQLIEYTEQEAWNIGILDSTGGKLECKAKNIM